MLTIRGTVIYKDGREEHLEGGAPALAAWDEYALRHGYPLNYGEAPQVLWQLVVLHGLTGTDEGFEVWRKQVEEQSG